MNDVTTLIIDDEENLTRSLSFALRQDGVMCIAAHDGASGLKAAEKERPDIIFLDLRLPDRSGLDVLGDLRAAMPDTPIVMISAHGDTKDAVQAIKQGAVDYVTKPFDVDELLILMRENIARKQLHSEVRYLRDRHAGDSGFVGNSPAIRGMRDTMARIARSSVQTIMLLGETGVGKAVIARELHNWSGGKDVPFVEVNCASLPEHLMEAELFGAEKGAYTGATSRRPGLVEIADKGTLFLDEIGELSPSLQAKLLTFLETRQYRPIGSPREKKANVRVIAATNRNLEQGVEDGTFRQDLYFRLNVMPIEIPRLSDRGDDIWLLANHFADSFARNEGCAPISFEPAVREAIETYDWPGNVRELKNLIERLTILYPEQVITTAQLPTEIQGFATNGPQTIADNLASAERELVEKALRDSGGKKGIAAEKLGISRHALKRRLLRLGME